MTSNFLQTSMILCWQFKDKHFFSDVCCSYRHHVNAILDWLSTVRLNKLSISNLMGSLIFVGQKPKNLVKVNPRTVTEQPYLLSSYSDRGAYDYKGDL